MKTEADFKSAFKRSVKAQSGFAISLAAPMISGLPDLYVSMPGYTPLILEAKWFGEVKICRFSRKIPYSKMQLNNLNDINKVNDYTAMGLMGFKYGGECMCALVHPRFEYLDSESFFIKLEKIFDVKQLLSKHPIPRISGPHASTSPTLALP